MKQYTHYPEKIANDYVIYTILLGLLALAGFYKNGFGYYLDNQLTFWESLKPLCLALSGLISGSLVDIILKHRLSKNCLFGFLISICLPYQTSILMAFLLIFIGLLVISKFNITICPLFVIELILIFLAQGNYNNIIESKMPMFYKTIDIFLGRSIGGVGSTNICLLIICLIILSTRFYYKKEIPFITIGVYALLTVLVAIFYLPFNDFSPLRYSSQIIYSIVSGFLLFVGAYFWHPIIGPFIGGFMANLVFYLKEILSKKKKFIASE